MIYALVYILCCWWHPRAVAGVSSVVGPTDTGVRALAPVLSVAGTHAVAGVSVVVVSLLLLTS